MGSTIWVSPRAIPKSWMDPISILVLLGLGVVAAVAINNRASNGASALGEHQPLPPMARVGAGLGMGCGQPTFDKPTSAETLEDDLGGLPSGYRERVLQHLLDPTTPAESFQDGAQKLIAGCSPWIAGELLNSAPRRLADVVFGAVRLRRSAYEGGANGARVGLMMLADSGLASPEELYFEAAPFVTPMPLTYDHANQIQVEQVQPEPAPLGYNSAPSYAPLAAPSSDDSYLFNPTNTNPLAPPPTRQIYLEQPVEIYEHPPLTYENAPPPYQPTQLINSPPPQYTEPSNNPPEYTAPPPGGSYQPPGTTTRFRLPVIGEPPVPIAAPPRVLPPVVEQLPIVCCPRGARRLWIIACEKKLGLHGHLLDAAKAWSSLR